MINGTDQFRGHHLSIDQLWALMMVNTEIIYSMSPDWKVMKELYGRDFPSDRLAPDADWLDKYIHPDDQANVWRVIERCIETKSIFEMEHRVLHADGGIGWTYSRAIPQFDDRGSITGWFGAASDITDRKRVEAELRESRATLEGFYSSSPFMMGVAELRDDRIVAIYGNEAVARFFGHPPRQLPGHTGSELGTPEAIDRLWIENYRRSQRESAPVWFEYQHLQPQGLVWLSATVSFLGLGVNGFPRFSFVAEEVTERKKLEAALRASEANYRSIVENAGEGVIITSMDGLTTFVNQRMADILGYAVDEMLGRSGVDFVFPDWEPRIYQATLQVREHDVLEGEFKLRRKDGSPLWTHFTAVCIFNERGEHVANMGLHTDITERKRTDQALRISQERQAFLLRLSDALKSLSDALEIQRTAMRLVGERLGVDCVMYNEITDKGQTIHIEDNYVREGFPKVTGDYPVSSFGAAMDVLRRGETLIIDDQTTTTLKAQPERAASTRLHVYASATVPLIKNGRWVANFGALHGKPRKWTESEIVILQETAERTWAAVERARVEAALRESEVQARDLVRKLEEADRNKNRFISVLSHELRNPLATIVMGQELMKHIPAESEKAKRTRAMQERQTAILTRMVEDLLDVTRIGEDKIQLKPERLDLAELVNQTAADMNSAYDYKGIGLHVELPSEPIFVKGDRVRLAQSIGNLLHNALKFSQPGKNVAITVAREADRHEAMVRVRDQGAGLEPEALERIFQPFTQADQALARTQGGLGLGLSIVKGMVELHGGHVEAESAGLGEGATFTIYLPLL